MIKQKSRTFMVVGLIFLLLGASVVLGTNVGKDKTFNSMNTHPLLSPLGRDWSENFDSYAAGSALHGQGNWAGWDNNAAATGYVSGTQSHSSPNSVEIKWFTTVAADMVQQFSGYTTGTWIFTAWLYVPSTMTGSQYFILMNTYTPGTTHNLKDWSLQVVCNAAGNYIRDSDNVAATLPLITNAWVQLRVEIDLNADIQKVFYNNVQFIQKSWKNGVASGGAQNIACVDLYAGDTTSTSCYWDDISLAPPIPPLTCDAHGPYEGDTGETIQFNGSATGGTPPYTWAWTFGDGGTASVRNPTHIYTIAGVYTVTLKVTDSGGKNASDGTIANITQAYIPKPEIEIGNISGGKGISVKIKNTGDANAIKVNWSIGLEGGIILKGKTKTGTIAQLNINEEKTVTSPVLGLGKVTITVTAGDKEKEASGFVFLFFVLNVK